MLSEALPVFPAKLVKKVEKGGFVDMEDFLKDNIEVERRRLAVGETSVFGLHSAPKIFSTVADGLQYMLKKEGVTCFHYLDDFFLAGQGGTDECSTVLTTALECCNELGVPVAPTKNSGAYNKACFLGD